MILIPMAGLSSRFRDAGYLQPKYALPLGERSVFAAAVGSFARYFETERFVFVCRTGVGAEAFIDSNCRALGIADHATIALDKATCGQAETVLRGLEGAGALPAESLLIFNIDTIRPGYLFPEQADAADGYLEVFEAEGNGWSFVQPAAGFSRRVARTTEKQRISRLCCTGLYHFARAGDFMNACRQAMADDQFRAHWGELYVAPLYNQLIAAGSTVLYHEVDASTVQLSGTPAQYDALQQLESVAS